MNAAEICYFKGFPLRKAGIFLFLFFTFFLDGFGQDLSGIPTYDFDGEIYWGSAGENSTDSLTIAIDTDSAGNIYRLTFGKGILKSDPDGQNETEFISPDLFNDALDFAIDSNNDFFIIDFEDQEPYTDNGKIKKFNSDGEFLPSETIYTSSFRPLGITIDADDYLYVAMYNDETTGGDSEEISQIIIYDPQGNMVGSPFEGTPGHNLNIPYRLAVDSEKNLYVSHAGNDGEVLVFNSDLSYIDTLNDKTLLVDGEEESLGSPGSIVIDSYGYIHVIDYADYIDFEQVLNYQNLTDFQLLILALNINEGVTNQDFNIKIYDPDRELVKAFYDYDNGELKLPVDIAFGYCSGYMYVDNANPNLSNLSLEFNLLKYNRTPLYDNIDPIAQCVGDFELQLVNGSASITSDDINNGSTDNCGIVNISLSKTTFTNTDIGANTVTMTVTDFAGNQVTCTVQVTVTGEEVSNQSPTAITNTYTTPFETVLMIDTADGVLVNDTDPENDDLTAILVDNVNNGILNLSPDGSFTYTPDDNFSGTDSFTYKASDGDLESNIVTVTITVGEAPNTAPTAVADNYSTEFESTLNISAAIGVLVNDTDPENDDLSAILVDNVTNGILNLSGDGSFTYTPDDNFSGTDSFTYKASDGDLESNIVTVTITVGEEPNTAPTAMADSYSTPFETELNVSASDGVLINDTDPENDDLTSILVDNVTNGILNLSPDGSFTYTPDDNFSGTDSFTYKASDGDLESNIVTVTITVGEDPNTAPTAMADSYSTPFETELNVSASDGVLINDTDPENDDLTSILVDNVTNGILNLSPDGSFTYTPDDNFSGTDSFTYKASDGDLESNIVTVTITVGEAPNTAPTAVADNYSTEFESTLNISAAIGVLVNDTDPEGDVLTAILVDDVTNGILTLNPDGSFSYTPDTDFTGEDTFTYMATDGEVNSNIVTVIINVTEALSIICPADKTESLDAGCSFTVPDYRNEAQVTNGDPAQVIQTPAPGTVVTGSEIEISFRIEEGEEVAECTFMVKLGDNTDPVALCVDNYTINLEEGQTISLDPSQLDTGSSDNCGDVSLSLDKTEFTSADEGDNTVTLTVTDGAGNSTTCETTVTVTVSTVGTNQPPVAFDEEYTTEVNTSLNVPVATGVLANDTDPENDPLTAVLDTDVQNGTLQLEPDGSFVYTPDNGFTGQDFFTYMANDGEYNSNTISVTINVVDSNGDFNCSSQVVLGLGPEGETSLDIELLYTGNAEGLQFSANQLIFSCDDIGENTVTLSYSGRLEGTCEIPVTVVDDTAPVLQVRDIDIDLNPEGRATISFEDINNGSFDECDTNVTYTLSKDSFSCKEVGANEVQVTAEDESGNVSTATVVVRVFAEYEICNDPLPGSEYIFIYPNPSSGDFKIATPGDVSVSRIEIFDSRGRFITAKDFQTNETEYAMYISPVQEGVYVLKLDTNEGVYIKRLIYQRE